MDMQITGTQISCRGTLLEAFCTRHIKRSRDGRCFLGILSCFPNKNHVEEFFRQTILKTNVLATIYRSLNNFFLCIGNDIPLYYIENKSTLHP